MFIPPPLLLFIAIMASYGVSLLFPGLQYNGLTFSLFGLILITTGVMLFIWAANTLRAHKTSLHPRHKPTKLVMRGPYGYSRNPIYLGFLLVATGTALLFANVLAFVGPIIFFAFVSTFIIPFEEEMLSKKFGKNYHSYRKNTRRWV